MTIEKLKVDFGRPENGWLPLTLNHGDFRLDIRASNVPTNPLTQLISSIRQVTKGINSETSWNLEPETYFFQFDNEGDRYRLKIEFSNEKVMGRNTAYQVEGTFDQIVMPFYRSIKNFASRTIDEEHWPTIETVDLDKLTETVKRR